MSAGFKVEGQTLRQNGRFDNGILITNNTIIGETYPRSWGDWLTQCPALRRRARVLVLRERLGWEK